MKHQITSSLNVLVAALASAQLASATTIIASFDARSETDGDPGPSNSSTVDLAVGPISLNRAFRSYLTFDLTSAPTVNVGGTVELILSHTTTPVTNDANEGNTSALAQDFILFRVASDWDGASPTGGGPESTTLVTLSVTPTVGNHSTGVTFSGANLINAYNSAIGGNLYLGIKSSAENTDNRSFIWFGSSEDATGSQPLLDVVVPEPSAALLGGLGLLALLRRRR